MQTATSETESKVLDLSICVHQYTLRAPCSKGQGKTVLSFRKSRVFSRTRFQFSFSQRAMLTCLLISGSLTAASKWATACTEVQAGVAPRDTLRVTVLQLRYTWRRVSTTLWCVGGSPLAHYGAPAGGAVRDTRRYPWVPSSHSHTPSSGSCIAPSTLRVLPADEHLGPHHGPPAAAAAASTATVITVAIAAGASVARGLSRQPPSRAAAARHDGDAGDDQRQGADRPLHCALVYCQWCVGRRGCGGGGGVKPMPYRHSVGRHGGGRGGEIGGKAMEAAYRLAYHEVREQATVSGAMRD